MRKLKVSILIIVVIFTVLFSILCFSEAANVQTSDGLILNISDKGNITQISTALANRLGGSDMPSFSVRDIVSHSDLALSESVSMQADNSLLYTATEANNNPVIGLKAVFKGKENRIDLDIDVQSLTDNNRFLIVSFALPVNTQGWTWGDDIRKSRPIAGTTEIQNTVYAGFGYHNQTSRYPIGAIYGSDGIAIGYPLDHPAAIRLSVNPVKNQLVIAFDVALSPLSKVPNSAHLKAVIYRFDPAWGFRAAIKKYYDIYPELFKKRLDKEGLWVFHPNDLSHITGINDFGIAYHTVGFNSQSLCFEDANNIYSLRYLTLAGEETFCNFSGDLISYLNTHSEDRYLQSVLNSGTYDERRNYVVYPSDNDICSYTGNKNYSTIVVNNDPDINEPNIATYLWNNSTRLIYSNSTNKGIIDGEFIDAVEGQSNAKHHLDYRDSHITVFGLPLAYSYKYDPQLNMDILIPYPGVPVVSGIYKFLRWLKTGENGITSMNKLMMGNFRLKRYLPSAHLMDIMGVEIDMNGQVDTDGNFSLKFNEFFNLWRTMSYQKPYSLLMYLPKDRKLVTHDMVEHYFKNALFYGFYPGFRNDATTSSFLYFKTSDMYERDRNLFKKYLPLIQRLGKSGWEPVTYVISENPNIYIERYGIKSAASAMYITTRNISEKPVTYTLTMEKSPLRLTASDLIFIDMITGNTFRATTNGSEITLTDTLKAKDVRMLAIKNNVCTDNDDDGYAIEGDICGLVDCDDNDKSINPKATEIATNHKDDDCNPATYDRTLNSGWERESVDRAGNVGSHTSIAVDSNGKAHISYRDETKGVLKYATNASSSWKTTTIDSGDTGEYSSIALDSSGSPHISYYDRRNKYLKYATNASGKWVITIVDNRWNNTEGAYDKDAGKYSSIDLDSNNKVYILYHRLNADGRHRIMIASDASGTWKISMIDFSRVVKGLSLSIDSSNTFHVAYYREVKFADGTTFYNLVYKRGSLDCTDGTHDYPWAKWSSTIIDSINNADNYPSIVTDSSKKVHISYYDAANKILRYATNRTGEWVTQTIDNVRDGNVGQYTSIATDSSDKIYISYYDISNKNLRYATNASGIWVSETVDNEGAGLFNSIAVTSSGDAHISYYDSANGDLKYAKVKRSATAK